jgi:hypothetical protein
MEDGPQYPKFSLHAELRHWAINELLISKEEEKKKKIKSPCNSQMRISHRMLVR